MRTLQVFAELSGSKRCLLTLEASWWVFVTDCLLNKWRNLLLRTWGNVMATGLWGDLNHSTPARSSTARHQLCQGFLVHGSRWTRSAKPTWKAKLPKMTHWFSQCLEQSYVMGRKTIPTRYKLLLSAWTGKKKKNAPFNNSAHYFDSYFLASCGCNTSGLQWRNQQNWWSALKPFRALLSVCFTCSRCAKHRNTD